MNRTKYLETSNEGIKSQKLSSIADVCNQFLLPYVLCSWEFLDFMNKFGCVDLDTVIQKIYSKIQPFYC